MSFLDQYGKAHIKTLLYGGHSISNYTPQPAYGLEQIFDPANKVSGDLRSFAKQCTDLQPYPITARGIISRESGTHRNLVRGYHNLMNAIGTLGEKLHASGDPKLSIPQAHAIARLLTLEELDIAREALEPFREGRGEEINRKLVKLEQTAAFLSTTDDINHITQPERAYDRPR